MDEQEAQRILQTIMDQQSRGIPLTAEQLKQLKEVNSSMSKFNKGVKAAAKTLIDGLVGTAKQLAQGQRGITAYTDAMDSAAKVMGIGAVAAAFKSRLLAAGLVSAAAGLKTLTGSLALVQKQIDGFQMLAKVGAQGAQGLASLQDQFVRARLPVARFTEIISKNSVALARMSGSTALGAEKMSEVFAELTTDRGLIRLGMMPDQIAEMTSEFTKQQTRLGFSQTLQTSQLAASTKDYLVKLNALAALTGNNVDELQRQRDQLLSETRFRAKYQQMMASGDEQQIQAAEKMMSYVMSLPPELAAGAKDLFTAGTATTVEGQRAMLMGLDKVVNGLVNDGTNLNTALRETQTATKAFTDQYGGLMAMIGDEAGGGLFKGAAELYDFQTRSIEDLDKIRERQRALIEGQGTLNKNTADLIAKTAETAANIDKIVNSISNMTIGAANVTADIVNISAQGINPVLPGRAEGGPTSSGKPYLVGEKGPEMFVPNTDGNIVPGHLNMDPRKYLSTLDWNSQYREVLKYGSRLGDTGNKTIVVMDPEYRKDIYANLAKEQGAYAETMSPHVRNTRAREKVIEEQLANELLTSQHLTMSPRKMAEVGDYQDQEASFALVGSRLGDDGVDRKSMVVDDSRRKQIVSTLNDGPKGDYKQVMGPHLAKRRAKDKLVEDQLTEETISQLFDTGTGDTGAGSDAALMKEQNAKLDELINLQKRSVNTQGKMLSASYS